MEKKKMQEPDRIEQQLEELKKNASFKAELTDQHRQIATERKQVADLEVNKFQAMLNALTIGSRALGEQLENMKKAEEPNPLQIQAHEAALGQLQSIMGQAEKAIANNQGAFTALSAMEETLKQKAMEATARARGLEVQESRSVDLASRKAEDASQGDSAKEPIVPPQQRDNASQGPQEGAKPPSEGAIGSP